MAKESNGKIISLLKEVLAKVGGGSGEDVEIVCSQSATFSHTGKGTVLLYCANNPSITVDGIECYNLCFANDRENSSYCTYKIPFFKSVLITNINSGKCVLYKNVII